MKKILFMNFSPNIDLWRGSKTVRGWLMVDKIL